MNEACLRPLDVGRFQPILLLDCVVIQQRGAPAEAAVSFTLVFASLFNKSTVHEPLLRRWVAVGSRLCNHAVETVALACHLADLGHVLAPLAAVVILERLDNFIAISLHLHSDLGIRDWLDRHASSDIAHNSQFLLQLF